MSFNMFFVLLLVWLFKFDYTNGQISLSSQPCGHTNGLARLGRVVGGTNSVNGETPYIVSLTRRGGHFCGGSILNQQWVLTAGHCLCNGVNKIMKPTQVKGSIGMYKISDLDKKREISFDRVVMHPGYQCTKAANDIALLKLHQPMNFNSQIQPICISTETNNHQSFGNYATISGWGWTNEDHSIGKRSDILQKASVEIWNNQICEDSYRSISKLHKISQSQLCAGKKAGGIDACWADSGGPLVDKNNVLIGVVSTGIGCGRPGLPGIYTRVSEYGRWIQDMLRSE